METGNNSENNDQYIQPAAYMQNDIPIYLINEQEVQNEVPEISNAYQPVFLTYTDNQSDVLNAAKSLFIKRTKTLYNWMYPNASKVELLSAIHFAWDTMEVEEKQFYISEVSGKSGDVPHVLMVNPQLRGFFEPSIPDLNIEQPNFSNVETYNDFSNLSEEDSMNWVSVPSTSQHTSRKRVCPFQHQVSAVQEAKVRKFGEPDDDEDADDPTL